MPKKRKRQPGTGYILHSPPVVAELLASEVVRSALESAWVDSEPDDSKRRHEEGGWIYMDVASGAITLQRAKRGTRAQLYLGNPPIIPGNVVVGTFHTHPNPSGEGWQTGASSTDELSAMHSGVPWIIRAEDGVHTTGPDRRRGGFEGNPGFPI